MLKNLYSSYAYHFLTQPHELDASVRVTYDPRGFAALSRDDVSAVLWKRGMSEELQGATRQFLDVAGERMRELRVHLGAKIVPYNRDGRCLWRGVFDGLKGDDLGGAEVGIFDDVKKITGLFNRYAGGGAAARRGDGRCSFEL